MGETLRPNIKKENSSESKTLRAPEKKTNVLPSEKTLRPEIDKTLRKAPKQSFGEKTARPNEVKTSIKTNQKAEKEVITKSTFSEFNINDKLYNVVKIISDGTGEAQIYLVEHNGEQCVLKLYFPHLVPPPNFKIIETVKTFAETGFFVEVFDCGEWTEPVTGTKRMYELMEYCTGGTLQQLNINKDEKLIGQIALQCAGAIQFLNSKNIIHRDIKPSNFFFVDDSKSVESLRLADFGIAIETDNDGVAVIKADLQLRTPIYTAPEYYYTIAGDIQFDYKSDFYSLGMMLLVLWDGEKIFDTKEYELRNLKIHGTLPYPADVSNRTLQLLKALTDPNPKTRADYEDIIRWVKGEDIYDLKEKSDEGFNILFDSANNLVANSKEELGQIMYDNPELAVKYLYSGKIAQWLTENKCPELAIEMEDIVENIYPKDRNAGLWAACYFLNASIPYYDVKDEKHSSSETIAQTLSDNFEYYVDALANKNDRLYIFLNLHGAEKITQKFTKLFKTKSNNDEALRQLIYTLNPNIPWILTNENNKKFECNSIDEVINTTYNEVLSHESWNGLRKESFLLWVRNQNPAIEGKIRSQEGYEENTWCVLYNLNPKVSYTLCLNENDDAYFFTAADIASFMNSMLDFYIHNEEFKDEADTQLDMMVDIDKTRLYYYLKSKGVYDDKIDWIKYCADVESEENSNKYAPYNWITGVYKSIKGLGIEPYYRFPDNDKYVYDLDELNTIPVNEVKEELENGYLKEWLTLFFQENPDEDLSQKYTFEKLTVNYVDFISKYNIDDTEIQCYNNARNDVIDTHSKLQRNYRFNKIIKIALGAASLLSVGFVSYKLLSTNLTYNTDSKWLYIIPLIIGYFVGKYRWSECFDSFIKSFLIGLGVFAALAIAISLSISYPFYILAGLLVAGLIWVAIVGYIKPRLKIKSHEAPFNPGFEELNLEPLHYAFVAEDGEIFESSIGAKSLDIIDKLKKNTKNIIKYTSILIASAVLVGVLQTYLSKHAESKQFEKAKYSNLAGEYKGVFDSKEAVFTIVNAEKQSVNAQIEVRYKNLITEKLKGEINIETKSFHFDDIDKNNKLDGEYNGYFNEEFTEISGTYKNYNTKKEVEFKFSK